MAGLALLVASSAAVADDDEEKRAAAAIAKQAATAPGKSVQLGGYLLNWRGYVETEGGVDTNPDNQFDEDGTGLLKLEGGMRTTLENAREYYALTLKGRFLDFRDIEGDEHRTDFKAALDTTYKLSETETVTAGTYFLRDLISLNEADIYHTYLDYAVRTDTYRLKFAAKNHTEHNFDNEVQGTRTADAFAITRPHAFDHSRSDGQVRLLAFTQGMLQPFLIYDYADINYYNQTPGASIDRDAREHYGIAGLRFQFDKNFRIDAGYRYNYRDFDDRTVTHASTDFIDINIFWQPLDNLKFTGVVERYFDESTTSLGVVDDVQTYGVTFDWDISPKWRLAGTTYHDRERALGDTIFYKKITSTLSLTHYMTDHVELFVSGLGKWVEEDTTSESYERYKVGSGIRVKY